MTVITRVLAVPATGAGYCEDRAALAAESLSVPARFEAQPVTPGFRRVREVTEAVSVGLVLDGAGGKPGGHQVAWGDCLGVAYAATAGREPPFRTEAGLATIRQVIAPFLQGRALTSFRELSSELDALTETVIQEVLPVPDDLDRSRATGQGEARSGAAGVSRRSLLTAPLRAFQQDPSSVPRPDPRSSPGKDPEWRSVTQPLRTAVCYGVSQALLQAVALAWGVTMAEVVAADWGLPLPADPVPIHAQSGAERTANALKMIVRRVASLPHALIDDIPGQLGEDGDEMTRYLRWLVAWIPALGGPDYRPAIHLDLHGALGAICGEDLGRMLGQLYAWERAAMPYPLRIESPTIRDSRQDQIEALHTLRDYVRFRKMRLQLVADEWANTLDDVRTFLDAGAADMIQVKMPNLGGLHNSVDAVLACRAAGVGALLGGSYAETDLSGRIAAHVALATRPDLVMARPGFGVDEAVSLFENEMARALAEIRLAGPN